MAFRQGGQVRRGELAGRVRTGRLGDSERRRAAVRIGKLLGDEPPHAAQPVEQTRHHDIARQALLWQVAQNTGTVDNVEKFFEQFGWESFEFKGGEIYHNAWIGGLFVSIGLTGFAVLMATLFNLITDQVGPIRVRVLEEEVVAIPRG